MPRKQMRCLIGVLVLAAMPVAMESQQTSGPDMTITSLSLDGMMKFIQNMGFECTRDKSGQFFTFQAEGYKVATFVYNQNTDAQLYAGFTDVKPTLIVVNKWNQANRFSKAYVDDNGDATLVADLDFVGGVTDKNIEQFVKLFRDSLARYVRFCIDNGASKTK